VLEVERAEKLKEFWNGLVESLFGYLHVGDNRVGCGDSTSADDTSAFMSWAAARSALESYRPTLPCSESLRFAAVGRQVRPLSS